jgi:hypothetical protein
MAVDPFHKAAAPQIAINALNLPPNLAGIGFYLRKLLEHMGRREPRLRFTVFTNRQAAPALFDLKDITVRSVPAPNVAVRAMWGVAGLPFRLSGFHLLHSIGNVGLPFSPIPQVLTIHDLCQRSLPGRFGVTKRAWLNLGQAWSAWSVAQVITVSLPPAMIC